MRRAIALAAVGLLLAAGRCAPDPGGGYVDDGHAFKRPPTPIPAIPIDDDRRGLGGSGVR